MSNLQLKQNLGGTELQVLSSEMNKRQKSPTVAWLLWFFLGGIGGHRYYLGRIGTAILMTLTIGCIGIWTLIDLFFISKMIRKANEKIESEVLFEMGKARG